MSETKHTTGPWVALRSIPEEGCDGWWIKAQPHAALRGFTHDLAWVNGGQENEANARLIAAAPDMLEALRACEATFTFASGTLAAGIKIDWEGLAREFNRRQKIAAAAIAKAEGRS